MFKKLTLESGLRIVLVPQLKSLATTILVLVEAGSKYEKKEIRGISHFLEHMCFKGTEKRPRAIDIASELEGIGAVYNAFTSLEYTGYYAKARSAHFENILDIVSDIYLNQIFDSNEIEKEKGVIVEEINSIEDIPQRKVQRMFLELLYGDQPAGWEIAGTKDSIKNLTRENFIDYQKQHYLAKSTIVVVAGLFDEEKAVQRIKEYFSQIPNSLKGRKIKTIEKQSAPNLLFKKKETEQTHLILGIRAFDAFDERKYALGVLSSILGGGMSSRLFQKIREEMGAAYYIGADSDFYTDHGYLAVYAGVDNSRIEEVVSVVVEELRKIAKEEVGLKELERVKEHIKGRLVLGLETSDQLADFYGDQEVITKKLFTPEQVIEKIQAVTKEQIVEVAGEIIKNENLNLALIGPSGDEDKFRRVLKL